ncbi:MAG TPA: pilus assembly protein PilM [Tepidisphaeraceae bacterium]|jgi:type IV pilus assembly protein PilM|nr:pilus assembly protein PilM [Tepidisphaeraceae bacterium]
MFGLVKNLVGGKSCPIGVDFGTDSLRLAQVAPAGQEWKLVAAASADVPSHVRHDNNARMQFFVQTTKDLLSQGGFTGRSVVLALPAASMFIQHLRLPKMDDEAMKKAIPWEARGKIPIDPGHALLRHHIAGEVYQDQEAKCEIVLMAAGRDLVNQLLAMAAKARLDVVGMNVEPKAIVDCFTHLYRRKNDSGITNFFVDIGCAGTRAFIARGPHILFARAIHIAGDHFTRAVASAFGLNLDEAKLLRLKLCNAAAPERRQSEPEGEREAAPAEDARLEGMAMLGAALAAARGGGGEARRPAPAAGAARPARNEANAAAMQANDTQQQVLRIEQACRDPLNKLIHELEGCRRYYEATFPNKPVDRLVFVGGEAKHRNLCQHVAREMGLAAQVGDPMVRLSKVADIPADAGIDPTQPQPNWAVALGLSMGPADEGK